MIRILIVDDHWMVLDGLRRLLEAEEGFEVVATARRAGDAIRHLDSCRPDVAVVDLRLPDASGMDVVRAARTALPDLKIILLTAHLSEADFALARRLNVEGILLKDEAPEVLTRCVRVVGRGGVFHGSQFSPAPLDELQARKVRRAEILRSLTPREFEVAQLAAEGLRTREIAAELGIAAGTVKIHLHSAYEKLAIGSRVELANLMRGAVA